jgi:hypothetical protein
VADDCELSFLDSSSDFYRQIICCITREGLTRHSFLLFCLKRRGSRVSISYLGKLTDRPIASKSQLHDEVVHVKVVSNIDVFFFDNLKPHLFVKISRLVVAIYI